MKKKALAIIAVLVLVIGIMACGSTTTTINAGNVSDIESSLGLSSNEFKNFMVYVGSYGETMKIYKDTETGVYYIVYTTDNGCCITPRYNISGSLYVD